MIVADRIRALDEQVRALRKARDEMAWRMARAEATTILVHLRSQFVDEQRQSLADHGAGARPVETPSQLRRVRELIAVIDEHLRAIA